MPLPPAASPYRRGRFDLAAWRARFAQRLTSRFGLRLHMTLVVGLVFAAAFLTTRGLLALGVRSMGARYLVASLIGYAAFFGLVRAWLWYVTADAGDLLEPGSAPDEVALAIDPDAQPRSTPVPGAGSPEIAPVIAPRRRSTSSSVSTLDVVPDVPLWTSSSGGGGGSSGGSSGGLFDIDGEGVIAVLVIALVALVAAAILGAAGYIIYQAPTLLGEAAFEAVLGAVLARSSRKVTRDGWTGSVLAASWKPALILTLIATCAGFAVQGLCPSAVTMRGAIKACVSEQKKP